MAYIDWLSAWELSGERWLVLTKTVPDIILIDQQYSTASFCHCLSGI